MDAFSSCTNALDERVLQEMQAKLKQPGEEANRRGMSKLSEQAVRPVCIFSLVMTSSAGRTRSIHSGSKSLCNYSRRWRVCVELGGHQ